MNLLLVGAMAMMALSHSPQGVKSQKVLASLADLKTLGFPILAEEKISGVGLSLLTPEMQEKLQVFSHHQGKCGGFEVITEKDKFPLENLRELSLQYAQLERSPLRQAQVEKKASIEEAISLVQDTHIQETVTWLSNFKNRLSTSPTGSEHIFQMKTKIENFLKDKNSPWAVEIVSHTSTQQKSLRARLVGHSHPDEIIV